MADEKVTVEKLLSEDDLKNLADMIVGDEIDNIIIIYRDKKAEGLRWATTARSWATVFGSMKMAQILMEEEWIGMGGDNEDNSG